MNQEPLPQIHLIRDTDLSIFAYELHIFAGDFLRECEFNMRSLATNTGADSIAIMGKNHMWLSDALFAYCSTADLHQMISTTEFIGARVFLFHTDRREGGHLYGDVLMMDLDTLRQDIKRNILYPCGVNVERKDGSAATVSLKEWTEMELYEKDALKSWGFSYAPNQVTEWQYHYSTMFRQWMDQAFRYMPQDLEERLNCRHSEVAETLPCHGVRIKMADLEQVVFETIRAQMCPALGIDSNKDKLDLQTVQQAEHEEKLRSIQDSKRYLYEQYALGEIDLETYRTRKAVYDTELVQAKNVHAVITAQTKQIKSDYEIKLKQQEIVQKVGNANMLTKALIDRLINKVYVFPGDRIEIEYATQDFLETKESEKEV